MGITVIWSAVSHRFPDNGAPESTVFRTRFKRKHLRVACVVGRSSRRGRPTLGGNGELAVGVLERAAEVVTQVGLMSPWEVPLRMRDALAAAEANEALLLVCNDGAIYSQACALLNAQFAAEDLAHFSWQEP
ncbi:hypothetical protein BIY45_01290 [Stenotrophomonas sp. BIIR7]|nr:hypothetical protein BIY45_01290 [Stenotrophomonas sp. BIIR7]